MTEKTLFLLHIDPDEPEHRPVDMRTYWQPIFILLLSMCVFVFWLYNQCVHGRVSSVCQPRCYGSTGTIRIIRKIKED